MSLLKTKNLGISFGGLRAVDQVELDINDGELVGLIGPNGAGKTTIFNLLTGVYKPTDGDIEVGGVNVNKKSTPEIVSLGIARTFQNIREEQKVTEKALEILDIFEMAEMANIEAGNLSYGQQRRLEIARALATGPKLLLLDEPAAGMNPQETKDLMETISFIREKFKITILLIEHDMGLVMGICEKLYVLNFGKMIAQGTPTEIQNNPEVIAAYLGE